MSGLCNPLWLEYEVPPRMLEYMVTYLAEVIVDAKDNISLTSMVHMSIEL